MTKKIRFTIFSILGALVALLISVILINTFLKNKVENFITTRLPDNITQTYEHLDLDSFNGTLTFKNVTVGIKSKVKDSIHTTVNVSEFVIEDISYWDYLVNSEIRIEDIKLRKPEIIYRKHHFTPPKDSAKPLMKIFKPIRIDELSIDNATLTILDKGKAEIVLYSENTTVEIDDILISAATLSNRLPFEFGDYDAKSDSIFVKMNPYENLSAKNFLLKNHTATVENIKLKTKYSKSELSRIIPKERDHFNVDLEKLTLQNINFGFQKRKLFFKSSSITFDQISAAIYRDKLVKDDPIIKPLYSKLLRELPFDLTIDSAYVNKGNLIYKERIKEDNSGGSVSFKNVEAKVYNVSNTYKSPSKTKINANATFMKNTPFTIDWSFDVNNLTDRFLVKVDVGAINATDLNQFTEPNLGIRLTGALNKTYMTTSGDRNIARSDMKINYDDFKVNILDKDGKEKNKLLSAIANIFISKDSKKDTDNYREASFEVTPNRTKSFFNYAWLNIKEGLIKSMTGRNKD
tara:strand:- start:128009 stop:129568 length:1560 start_codon:yes stop_codon:yes gene_type:complete